MAEQYCLLDIWRIHNGDSREYSWHKRGNIHKASRIDFVLVSGGIDQEIELVQYLSSIKTDHRAIYMVIKSIASERGTGYWKMNTLLLQDPNFVEHINKEIDSTLETAKQKKPKEKWELIKTRIKKSTIEFARNKTSEAKLVISQLFEKVNDYEANLPLNKEDDKILPETKRDMEDKVLREPKE